MTGVTRLWQLINNLRRRRVFRVTGVYLVFAWIAIEVSNTTFPLAGLPDWTPRLVLVLVLLGLPAAVALAWAYDLTPSGVKRTDSIDTPQRWAEAQRILAGALELQPHERSAYLARAAGSDTALRTDVLALLQAHETSSVLDSPPLPWMRQPAAPSAARPAAGTVVGSYEILAEMDGGAMGILYRARDRRLERTVALKFLPPHLSHDDDAKQRLLTEAQAAAALDHPHVCTLLEIGEVDGHVYLAMPYYDGETLKRRLERGPLPLPEALDLAVQAASGLAAAHAKAIVHRDIKPANLIITADGVLKILDFGIAKLADVAATAPGMAPGTAAYMSPEQARGKPVDARTDVWSLGIVLYESLVGHRPFDTHDGPDFEPVATLRPDVPDDVDVVLRRALARDPNDRYRNGAELRDALGMLMRAASLDDTGDVAHGTHAATELPPEGERRQATVVISALSGYARLVEAAPPAELRSVLARIGAAAQEQAARFGGRVNSFEDGRIEMLFGAPESHEDHCFRAIRATLELHERVRAITVRGAVPQHRLALHSGVDAGQLVVQPTGNGARFRLIGGPTLAAARLQAHAAPDEVWITPVCQRMVGPFFDTAPRDAVALGGGAFDTPHHVLRLSGLRTRMEAAQRIGLTRYVGRDHELDRMCETFTAARTGHGQALVVLGEAGVGKSRLMHEFRAGAGDMALFLEGRCQSYGVGSAYMPFVDVLRAAVNTHASHTDDAAAVVAAIHAISSDLDGMMPLYLHLLSLAHPMYPLPNHLHGETLRNAMQEALAGLIMMLTRSSPVVLVLEDWHWADDASRTTLQQILEVVSGHPLLIVVTARPIVANARELSHVQMLSLAPLDTDASLDMLRTVLGADSLPTDLAHSIHMRTGGNPFFIEEVGRTLLEEGTIEVRDGHVVVIGDARALHLPHTVEAVIRGRLDRLDRDTREIARLASAVGREFERRLLEAAMHGGSRLPHALQTLKSAGLIQQIRVVPDATYRFNHVLTQEVAYASLLERQRTEVHGCVAEAIERVYASRLEEHYGRLADHFSSAGNWDKAVHYGMLAASRLANLSAFPDALEQLERCEEWIARGNIDRRGHPLLVDVLLRQERLCETLGLRARQQLLIDRVIDLLEDSDDPQLLAELYLRQGDLFTLVRRFADAERALLESLRLRRAIGDRDALRNTLRSLGMLRWHAEQPHEAIPFIEETIAIDRQHNDAMALIGDLSNLGAVLKGMGELDASLTALDEALSIFEQARARGDEGANITRECFILQNLANVHREQGHHGIAVAYLERAREIAEREHMPIQVSYHFTSLAHVALREGRIEDSLDLYRRAVAMGRRARYTPGLSQLLRMLGEVLLGLGRETEALPHLEEAASLFAQLEDHRAECGLWQAIARIHERNDNPAQALAAWQLVAALLQERPADAMSASAAHGGEPWRDGRGDRTWAADPWDDGIRDGAARRGGGASDAGNGRHGAQGDGRSGMAEPVTDALTEAHLGIALASKGAGRPADEVRAAHMSALQHATRAGARAVAGRLLNSLGIMAWERADYDDARAQYDAALDVYRELDDSDGVGLMLNSIAAVLKAQGRHDEARAQLEAALPVHRSAENRLLAGHAYAMLGDLALDTNDARRALDFFTESLALREQVGDRRGEGWMRSRLASTHMLLGATHVAQQHATIAQVIAEEIGDEALSSACASMTPKTTI